MKRIEDIKEFKDIDTYYEISKIVDEVFQDRVEAHKHLVTANKEIERLNNIINEIEKILVYEKNDYGGDIDIETRNIDSEFLRGNAWEADYILGQLKELKGSDKE